MRVWVENGLAGCRLAVEHSAVAIVVDALRASAMLASLLHYGAERVLVVREVEEAFAERERRPEAVLVGERGGPMVPGFDLGNSPLQDAPGRDIREVIFSSSNCSRCCVGAAPAPAAFLGTTVNASAVAQTVAGVCAERGIADLVLVTAGAAEDEVRLTLEDHLAAGAIITALQRRVDHIPCANDRARVCIELYQRCGDEGLGEAFSQSDNGRRLGRLGLGEDVEFASRLDVFDTVPRIAGLVELVSGGQGALVVKTG